MAPVDQWRTGYDVRHEIADADFGTGTPTLNRQAINQACARIGAQGGGIARLPQTGDNDPIDVDQAVVIPTDVRLVGTGSGGTTIRLAAGANTNVVESENFAALQGSNTWLVQDGMQHSFALVGVRVDGNAAGGNTAGHGVAFYGKGYEITDVRVDDAAEDGIYSEGGRLSGQLGIEDMPKTHIRAKVYSPGNNGMTFRGPHDGIIDQLEVSQAPNIGLHVDESADFFGGCEIGMVHTYGGGAAAAGGNGIGAVFDSSVLATAVQVESAGREGLIVNSLSLIHI